MQKSKIKNQNVGSNVRRGEHWFHNFTFYILHFAFARKRAGFTVIELLVVVAVIAMLASAVLALFGQERAKARDATREQNVKTLQTALNLYAVNARTYPASSVLGACVSSASCLNIATCGEQITNTSQAGSRLVQDGSIPSIPKDPVNQGQYQFYYSSNALSYTISYCLETGSIPQKSSGLNQATP